MDPEELQALLDAEAAAVELAPPPSDLDAMLQAEAETVELAPPEPEPQEESGSAIGRFLSRATGLDTPSLAPLGRVRSLSDIPDALSQVFPTAPHYGAPRRELRFPEMTLTPGQPLPEVPEPEEVELPARQVPIVGPDRRPFTPLAAFHDTITLGHSDELSALLGGLTGRPGSYAQRRDEIEEDRAEAYQQSPEGAQLGAGVGAATAAPLAITAAGPGVLTARGLATGAGMGAGAALGEQTIVEEGDSVGDALSRVPRAARNVLVPDAPLPTSTEELLRYITTPSAATGAGIEASVGLAQRALGPLARSGGNALRRGLMATSERAREAAATQRLLGSNVTGPVSNRVLQRGGRLSPSESTVPYAEQLEAQSFAAAEVPIVGGMPASIRPSFRDPVTGEMRRRTLSEAINIPSQARAGDAARARLEGASGRFEGFFNDLESATRRRAEEAASQGNMRAPMARREQLAGTVSREEVADAVRDISREREVLGSLQGPEIASRLDTLADSILAAGERTGSQRMTFREAHELRQQVDGMINYQQPGGPRIEGVSEATREARRRLGDLMEGSLGDLSPELREQWRTANRDYAQASQMLDESSRGLRMSRQRGQRSGGIARAFQRGQQAQSFNPASAMRQQVESTVRDSLGAWANDIRNGRQAWWHARMRDLLRNVANVPAGQALEWAEQGRLPAMHFAMMQSYPEYRQGIEEINELRQQEEAEESNGSAR